MNNWIDTLPSREWLEVQSFDYWKLIPLDEDTDTLSAVFANDEAGSLLYKEKLHGIECRWNRLMKRREQV